jgi:hypothetical protein
MISASFPQTFRSLTGETRHDFGNESVQMFVFGLLDLENVLTDVVQSFVLEITRLASSASEPPEKEKDLHRGSR